MEDAVLALNGSYFCLYWGSGLILDYLKGPKSLFVGKLAVDCV
jgi:hypothetical protein